MIDLILTPSVLQVGGVQWTKDGVSFTFVGEFWLFGVSKSRNSSFFGFFLSSKHSDKTFPTTQYSHF